LQPSLAFCFSLQPITAYRPAVIGCKLKQNANEGCNSCASLAGLVLCFIACFILLVIAPLFFLVVVAEAAPQLCWPSRPFCFAVVVEIYLVHISLLNLRSHERMAC